MTSVYSSIHLHSKEPSVSTSSAAYARTHFEGHTAPPVFISAQGNLFAATLVSLLVAYNMNFRFYRWFYFYCLLWDCSEKNTSILDQRKPTIPRGIVKKAVSPSNAFCPHHPQSGPTSLLPAKAIINHSHKLLALASNKPTSYLPASKI